VSGNANVTKGRGAEGRRGEVSAKGRAIGEKRTSFRQANYFVISWGGVAEVQEKKNNKSGK